MFKKYKLMRSYMKTIKTALPKINEYFKINEANFAFFLPEIKIDKLYRIYTVLNFPQKTTKLVHVYGHMYLDNETSKFISELTKEFKKYGLFELVELTKADNIGENNVLIVIEYKYSSIKKYYIRIFISIITILSLITFLGIFYFL